MNKETIYEWQNSIGFCFRGSLIKCNEWANQCVKEGWVRVNDTMTHPNHGQVLNLVGCGQLEPQVDFDLLQKFNDYIHNSLLASLPMLHKEIANHKLFFELEEVKRIIERN